MFAQPHTGTATVRVDEFNAGSLLKFTGKALSSQSQKNQHRLIDASHVCRIEMTDAGSQFSFWNCRNFIHHELRGCRKSVLVTWLDRYSKEWRFALVACDGTNRD